MDWARGQGEWGTHLFFAIKFTLTKPYGDVKTGVEYKVINVKKGMVETADEGFWVSCEHILQHGTVWLTPYAQTVKTPDSEWDIFSNRCYMKFYVEPIALILADTNVANYACVHNRITIFVHVPSLFPPFLNKIRQIPMFLTMELKVLVAFESEEERHVWI